MTKVGASAEFFCVKCRCKRNAKVQTIEHKKNADMLTAHCGTCSTKMCRFAKKS